MRSVKFAGKTSIILIPPLPPAIAYSLSVSAHLLIPFLKIQINLDEGKKYEIIFAEIQIYFKQGTII